MYREVEVTQASSYCWIEKELLEAALEQEAHSTVQARKRSGIQKRQLKKWFGLGRSTTVGTRNAVVQSRL